MAKDAEVEKAPSLVRVAKFQIFPTEAQLATLDQLSSNLRDVWNRALAERQEYFTNFLKPLYEEQKNAGASSELRGKIKEAFQVAPSHFSQCKSLTTWRQTDTMFAAVPCSWQQETLKILDGDYKSFAALRARGDRDSRPPRARNELGFCPVEGLGSWQLHTDTISFVPQKPLGEVHQHAMRNTAQMEIVLSPGKPLPGGAELRFAVPEYQRLVLASAVKLNKFTLVRDKKKRFCVSIAYSILKPEQAAVVPGEVVFVALGASHLSIISNKGEQVVDLWRPDKHWVPLINQAKNRGLVPCLQSEKTRSRNVALGYVSQDTVDKAVALEQEVVASLPERFRKMKSFLYSDIPPEQIPLWLAPKQKGSKGWERLFAEVDRMYEIMRLQQLQNQREVIARVLHQYGVHFVIIEHSPVRSKKGKLADAANTERGGTLGLNWQAQNTGSLARLKQLLEQKAAEWGGSVSTIKLEHYPKGDVREKKLEAARLAREQYLKAA